LPNVAARNLCTITWRSPSDKSLRKRAKRE
jgi:hypothetical protein